MARVTIPLLELCDELSDEAAAQLIESLYAIAPTLESHYAAQLYRHYHPARQRQPLPPPYTDDEPPF